jgi:hypothetical protein
MGDPDGRGRRAETLNCTTLAKAPIGVRTALWVVPKSSVFPSTRRFSSEPDWCSTISNCCPARLRPAIVVSNIEKTKTAPVVVIIGHDLDYWSHFPYPITKCGFCEFQELQSIERNKMAGARR